MTRLLASLILLLMLLPSAARAFYPVDGWWWNPAEPGRGFNIEMQDDVMFVSGFIYDAAGNPTWFTSSGRYNASTRRLQSTADTSTAGQCLGCPYRPPVTTVGGLGALTIQFDSAVHGTLSWAGGSTPIRRFWWAFGQPLDFLYGRFGLVMSSALNGDRVDLRSAFTASDGTPSLAGNRSGSTGSNNVAVAQLRDNEAWLLLDSTTSFYRLWRFDFTKDRWEGNFWLYEKTALPTGTGTAFHGFRIASRSFIQTGIGPTAMVDASDKTRAANTLSESDAQTLLALDPLDAEAQDHALHAQLSRHKHAATASEVQAQALRLMSLLQQR